MSVIRQMLNRLFWAIHYCYWRFQLNKRGNK